MSKPIKIAAFPDMQREIFAIYDATAEVYELFASAEGDDYLGCADTLAEAKEVAREIANEWMGDTLC